jgi:hypothetical protein
LQIGSSRLPEALLPPLLRNRWRIEGQGDIFVDRSLLLLDRRAASARGFMPHIVVSHDVRLRAGAGK